MRSRPPQARVRRAAGWPTSEHFFQAQKFEDAGDAKLVEHTEQDDYWGDGGDGSGRNMLGRILMEAREELRRQRA